MAQEREGHASYKRYSAECKRAQIERVLLGEVTAAESSRELGIARSQIRRWKHLLTKGGETAVASDEDVVPPSELRAAQECSRELERMLGRKQMAIEIFEAAQEVIKKKPHGYGVPAALRACEASYEGRGSRGRRPDHDRGA